MTRRTQAERRETTRAALLAAARELFAERGFADTGREDIAERAGVTRGALYHHFESKAAVAVAVLDALNDELVERVVAAASTTDDPREQLRRSAHAYVEACAEPSVARVLLDAPLVLSPERMRAINAEVCAQLLVPTLRRIGVETDPRLTALLVLGMLDDASTLVAADPSAKDAVVATLDTLLANLFPFSPGARRP
jgi:AcrR family transcriptional regulator